MTGAEKNSKISKILLIDDDPTIHKLITKTLSYGPYQVQNVYDSTNAMETVLTYKPDLVILDLMMPRVSGIEICQMIKGNPETKHTPVLILSAKEGQGDRIRGLEIGADDYVSKPFHVASLIRKIDYILSKNTPL